MLYNKTRRIKASIICFVFLCGFFYRQLSSLRYFFRRNRSTIILRLSISSAEASMCLFVFIFSGENVKHVFNIVRWDFHHFPLFSYDFLLFIYIYNNRRAAVHYRKRRFTIWKFSVASACRPLTTYSSTDLNAISLLAQFAK